MRREYDILQASGIYRLTEDPWATCALTLKPLQQYGRCANPLLLSALTLGIIPESLPGNYFFDYDLEDNGAIERRTHPLPVYERVSVWEWLVRRNDDEVLAEALAWSSFEHRPSIHGR